VKQRHLHVDCASGAAGDMMLGALIDLGVPIDVVGDALDAIGAGRWRLRVHRVMKHGIAAIDVKVDTSGELGGASRHVHGEQAAGHAHGDHSHAHGDHDHRHSHSPTDHAHAHYHYAAIRRRIESAPLTAGTRRRALDIFDRIARAEATLHGTTVDDVAFHEVGAIDSVVDVVGTAAALDWLEPRSVSCASVAMGHGTLTCAHGVLPVPAPAALEILREARGVMADGGLARELCTPTGAAILAASVTSWTAAPTGRPLAVGWGAGDAELADRANALRVIVVDTHAAAVPQATAPDTVWQIEANVDDMSPELCAPASDAIFAAGALDVWWAPILMKKGRPALLLCALATAEQRDAVAAAILRETTTIGVRYAPHERTVLARSMREVATPYGAIAVKVASDGATILNVAPEFEACAAAARRHGVPVKLVYAAALAAFESAR
jgi:pyridinium-3,5-bisthiocarboxylic acid mononucleotide nickel chelatase